MSSTMPTHIQAPPANLLSPECFPIEHQLTLDVHIFDTDCYGVMWHGAYTKWLELGRVDLFKAMNLHLKDLSDTWGIVCPVVEQRLKYKSPGKFGDQLTLTTQVSLQGVKFVFFQQLFNPATGRVVIEAQTDVVMINEQGRMYRQLPEGVQERLQTFL